MPSKNCKNTKKPKIKLTKIDAIILDLEKNPFVGVGKREPLKDNLFGFWSRRINLKDRTIYRVNENIVSVRFVSAAGYYSDKQKVKINHASILFLFCSNFQL
jgi:toxin YoeB